MERLKETDRRSHGRDGYLAIELIRQLVQIRCGELTSEEAMGKAWDKHRVFRVGNFGTTENLLNSMAETLRQAAPPPGCSQPYPGRRFVRNRRYSANDQ